MGLLSLLSCARRHAITTTAVLNHIVRLSSAIATNPSSSLSPSNERLIRSGLLKRPNNRARRYLEIKLAFGPPTGLPARREKTRPRRHHQLRRCAWHLAAARRALVTAAQTTRPTGTSWRLTINRRRSRGNAMQAELASTAEMWRREDLWARYRISSSSSSSS